MIRAAGLVQLPMLHSQGSINDLFVKPHLRDTIPALNRSSGLLHEATQRAASLAPHLAKLSMSPYIERLFNATRPAGTTVASRLRIGLPKAVDALLDARLDAAETRRKERSAGSFFAAVQDAL